MKKLFVVLFFVSFIAACNNGAGPEKQQYPFTNQTWRVNSGEQADWIGTGHMKAKASSSGVDTTIINNPIKYGLEIQQHPHDSTIFAIQFIDSTFNNRNAPEYSYIDSLFGQKLQTVHTSFYDNYIVNEIRYPFECGADPVPIDTLDIVYAPYGNPQDTLQYYRIVITGALATVNHIICEN